MESKILNSLSSAMERINDGFPINVESDFQSVLFGELYKSFPSAHIRFEVKLDGDYQSYTAHGSVPRKRNSRVDLLIETNDGPYVVEVKYLKGADKESKADMLADIAKVERIVESNEAVGGFCVQLIKPGVSARLPSGTIERAHYVELINGWNYDFTIKGDYEIHHEEYPSGHTVVFHSVQSSI